MLVVIFSLFVFLALEFFLKSTHPAPIKNYDVYLRIIKLFFSVILGGFIGTFVLVIVTIKYEATYSRDARWWKIEEPARHVVDQIRYEKQSVGSYPTEDSFAKKYSSSLVNIKDKAVIEYIYDERYDSFVLFVRPSTGDLTDVVLIYTSQPNFLFDRFSLNEANQNNWPATKEYPPNVPGPWDQLPKVE